MAATLITATATASTATSLVCSADGLPPPLPPSPSLSLSLSCARLACPTPTPAHVYAEDTYYGMAGRNSRVYVLDTGIDCNHPQFYRVAGDMSSGSRCEPGAHFGDGFARACQPCSDCADAAGCCSFDGHSHGTHCAGTIAGLDTGVAKEATVVAVKVLSDTGSGSRDDILDSLDWVLSQRSVYPNHTMVVSMSLGGPGVSQAYETAFASMRVAGIVSVLAAGNDNGDACSYSPAFAPSAITVGSTTSSDARSSFSNYGSCIQVYGPGSAVYSSVPGNGYASYSGTSMACPHTAGVVALYGTENPCLSGEQLFNYIASSATPDAVSDHDGGGTPGATPNLLIYTRADPRDDTCSTPDLPDVDDGDGTTCNPTTPPTAAPTAPTSSPTLSPTSPTASPQPYTTDNYMREMTCGEVLLGTTAGADAGVGNAAGDRWYTFEVDVEGTHEFDTCGSAFDTWLRIYTADETGTTPVPGTEVFSCDDCGHELCGTASYRTHLISGVDNLGGAAGHLTPGIRYLLVIDGYSTAEGAYRMTYTCPPSPPSPTAAPSPVPDPECVNGVPSADRAVCCDALCGECDTGAECWHRPGGENNCCPSSIESSGRSCLFHAAPCTIDTLSPTPSPTPSPTMSEPTSAPTAPTTAPTSSPTAPTAAPTPSPTAAPSTPEPTFDIHQGPIFCDTTVTATTLTPGRSERGNAAYDHYYSFEASQAQNYTFNSCGSGYDTWLRVFDAAWNQVASCDVRRLRHNFDRCPRISRLHTPPPPPPPPRHTPCDFPYRVIPTTQLVVC